MKKTLSIVSALLASMCFAAGVNAQILESGYFLDNYAYSYRVNAANMSEKSFVSVGLGAIDLGINSDLGVSAFVYPGPNGRLVTGLNRSVTSDELFKKVKNNNVLYQSMNLNLFSFGTRSENSMTTVELNIRQDANESTPGSIFRFLKEGSSATPYDISNLAVGAKAFGEIAIGHTRKITDRIVVGGRVKFLVGLANASLGFEQFDLTTNANTLAATVNANARIACEAVGIVQSDESYYVGGFDFDAKSIKPSGFGAAFDLGVKWYPFEGFSATFGINDLGGITWKYSDYLTSKVSATFNGLENVGTDTDLSKAFDKIWSDIKEQFVVTPNENVSKMEMLPFNMNLGARYRMPFYQRLSAGVLCTFAHNSFSNLFTTRFGATVTPVDWFSISGNYGFSNRSAVFGTALSVNLAFLNIHFGFDAYSGKCAMLDSNTMFDSYGLDIPLKGIMMPLNGFNFVCNFGMTIQFGQRYNDLKKS